MKRGDLCSRYQRHGNDRECCPVESTAQRLSALTIETRVERQTNLQETRNTNATSDSIPKASTGASITAGWMGGSTVGEMVESATNLRVDNAGAEGSGETWEQSEVHQLRTKAVSGNIQVLQSLKHPNKE